MLSGCNEMYLSGCLLCSGHCDHIVCWRFGRIRAVPMVLFPPGDSLLTESDAGSATRVPRAGLVLGGSCTKDAQSFSPTVGSPTPKCPLLT